MTKSQYENGSHQPDFLCAFYLGPQENKQDIINKPFVGHRKLHVHSLVFVVLFAPSYSDVTLLLLWSWTSVFVNLMVGNMMGNYAAWISQNLLSLDVPWHMIAMGVPGGPPERRYTKTNASTTFTKTSQRSLCMNLNIIHYRLVNPRRNKQKRTMP